MHRTSHYAAAVARRMGLNDDVTENICEAVPMHDVAKIGISVTILLKPGKLDPDRWEIMKEHASIGGPILARIIHELALRDREDGRATW